MPIVSAIEDVHQRVLGVVKRLAFLAPLLLRVTVGVVFVQTGWGHLTHMSDTIAAFRDDFGVPLPELNARIASVTEFFGGILVLVGLGTRLAALPLAFTMLVAIATAKRGQLAGVSFDSFTTLLGFEEWSYLVMFLVIALVGPGQISVDAFIARRLAHASGAPSPTLRPTEAPVGHG